MYPRRSGVQSVVLPAGRVRRFTVIRNTGYEEWLFFLNTIATFLLKKEKEEHTEMERLRREVQFV
jgi:hypothetical protein